MHLGTVYTQDMDATILRMWDEGYSSTQIAAVLGVTKNAIIGRKNRIGGMHRPSPIKEKGTGAKSRKRHPLRPGAVTVTALVSNVVPFPIPPPELPRPYARIATCCWPFGDVGEKDFRFCEDIAEPGKPYCGEHCAQAYVPKREKMAELHG